MNRVKNVIKNKKLNKGVAGKQGQLNEDFAVHGIEGLDSPEQQRVIGTSWLDFAFFMLDEVYQEDGLDAILENHWTDVICGFAVSKGIKGAKPQMLVDFVKNSEYPMHAIDNLRSILATEGDATGGGIIQMNSPLGVGGV
jgi:hypothetical protein